MVTISNKVRTLEIQRETNLNIEWFLASDPWSPLIVCFHIQAFQIIEARSIRPTDFLCIIKYYTEFTKSHDLSGCGNTDIITNLPKIEH